MSLVPALLIPVLFGFALVSLFWDRNRGVLDSLILKGSLSVGLGFGLTSALFFVWMLLAGRFGAGFVLVESVALLFFAGAVFLRRQKGVPLRSPPSDRTVRNIAARRLFALSFYGIVALALLAFVYQLLNRPHGGWDAWAMWNMRARFLFRGGNGWRDVFSVLGELHPDYPFLVPGIVARVWSYAGSDPVSVPAAASLGFTLATVFLLSSSLHLLRGGPQGYVAGIALLGATEFVRQGASQYADVYVGFFFLAALVLAALADEGEIAHRGLMVLAGAAAALAAWTKNEGILFLLLFISAGALAGVILDGTRAGLRRLACLLAGALPVAVLVLFFKATLAPPTDILAEQVGGALVARLLDPSRYLTVTQAFLGESVWKYFLPLWVVYLLVLGVDRNRARSKGFLTPLVTLTAMFFAYFMVYVTTSKPLQWHLDTSLKRVLSQLWPSFLFTLFLLARTPESLLATAQPEVAGRDPHEGDRRRKKKAKKAGKSDPAERKGRTR